MFEQNIKRQYIYRQFVKNIGGKKMKKLLGTLATVLLIGILAACGNSDNGNANDTIDDSTSNNVEQNDSMNNNDTNNEMADDNNNNNKDNKKHKEQEDAVDDNDDATEKMKELNIEEIEVETEYPDNKEYEVEIELESDGTYTAEIEDDLNDEYIKGQEAFDKLYPMVKALDVNPDSSK